MNTRKRYALIKYVYLTLVIMVGLDLLAYQVGGSMASFELVLTKIAVAIVLLIAYRGNPVFRYDSDGEVLVLESREPALGKIFGCNKLYEFPKRKLVNYQITNRWLRKILVLRVRSKDLKIKTVRIKISYLSLSEIRDMKRSLDSIIYNNKSRKLEGNGD